MVGPEISELSTDAPPEDAWSWRKVVTDARTKLEAQGFPMLPQPVNALDGLGFIEDVEQVNAIALANMTVRHQAWFSYATTEYGVAHAELRAFEEILDVKLGEEMHKLAKQEGARVVKDVLKAMAIAGDEGIRNGFRRKVELEQRDRRLEGLVKGLEIRCRALESEQIRRATAAKVAGGR